MSLSHSNDQTFSHRPPSVGVHLLSDPFPERISHEVSLTTPATAQKTGARKPAKAKKSTKRS